MATVLNQHDCRMGKTLHVKLNPAVRGALRSSLRSIRYETRAQSPCGAPPARVRGAPRRVGRKAHTRRVVRRTRAIWAHRPARSQDRDGHCAY